MMLQEDFSNEISSFLAVYSCLQFLKNNSLDTLYPKPELDEKEQKEDDDEEVSIHYNFAFYLTVAQRYFSIIYELCISLL